MFGFIYQCNTTEIYNRIIKQNESHVKINTIYIYIYYIFVQKHSVPNLYINYTVCFTIT